MLAEENEQLSRKHSAMANMKNLKTRLISAFLMIPGMFGAVATAIARNPEGLYQVLQMRGVRNQLKSQHFFLQDIADQDDVMQTIIGFVPAGSRAVLLQQLATANPAALSKILKLPMFQNNVVEVLAEDLVLISQVIELAAVLPQHGNSTAERVGKLHKMIADRPVFLTTLAHDAQFRSTYLEILERSLQLSGTTLSSALALHETKNV